MSEVMISAQGIHKGFGGTPVLKGVSLELARGEVVAIIGPSGSGKSTFLRCLNHLETIDCGTITIEGEVLARSEGEARAQYVSEAEIRQIGRKMGMVFQSFNLFPHLTVLENIIEAPVIVKGMKREDIIPRPRLCLPRWGWRPSAMPIPTISQAARSSAWRLRVRWPWSRTFCCSTSPPRHWTPS